MEELAVTPRAVLRDCSSVNLHSSWNERPWNSDGPALLEAVKAIGFGWVRDSMSPHSSAQQRFHTGLAAAGVGLHLNVTDSRRQYVREDVQYLADKAYVKDGGTNVHLAGPNEANAAGGELWAPRLVKTMADLYQARSDYLPNAIVTGPGLKHEHVKDYDGDLVKARGVLPYVDDGWLAFHYYNAGDGGPVNNATEWQRASAGYGPVVGIHEETGYSKDQTDPQTKARWSVETLLRNYACGIRWTNLYDLADDSTGRFGIVGTPAADALTALLATPDAAERFPGRLAHADDCEVVVTSDGDGRFTVYLMRAENPTATLVLKEGFKVDGQTSTAGTGWRTRWQVDLDETMTVLSVLPA